MSPERKGIEEDYFLSLSPMRMKKYQVLEATVATN